MGRCSGCTARCTSPTIRASTKNTTSRPATWASAASIPSTPALRRWSAGTNGIPEARAPRRAGRRADPVLSDRDRLVSRIGRRRTAQHQHNAWGTIQRSHAIANGVYVARSIASGHEGPAGDGLRVLGRLVSSPTRSGPHAGQSRRRRRDPGRGMRPGAHRSTCAATGPSCATGGSTPTARSPRRVID